MYPQIRNKGWLDLEIEVSIEKCFEEFDPYLCSVVMNSLNRDACTQIPLEKLKLVEYLKSQCRRYPHLAHRVKEALLKAFDSSRIKDPSIMKRVRDINLLYTLKFSFEPPLKIESKVTGRALELVVESVLKSKLKNNIRFDYEFVDWKGFDYLILDNDKKDWIAGIQCKTGFVGGFLGYQKESQKLEEFACSLPVGKTLIIFCGGVYKSKKEEVKHAFENKGWKLYYLWANINSYEIDESFYEFIDMIEQIVSV
jgi:hypothetical protein